MPKAYHIETVGQSESNNLCSRKVEKERTSKMLRFYDVSNLQYFSYWAQESEENASLYKKYLKAQEKGNEAAELELEIKICRMMTNDGWSTGVRF